MKLWDFLLASIIFLYILIYEMAPFLQMGALAPLLILKNLLIVAICFFQSYRNWHTGFRLPWYVSAYVIIMVALVVLEIVTRHTCSFISPIISLMEFVIIAAYADNRFVRLFYGSILLVTLISSIPLVYLYSVLGFYARQDIFFDKSMQTFLFGFSMVLLLLELIRPYGKHKFIIIVLFIYLLWCNAFILQSKTSIFVTLVAGCLLVVLKPDDISKQINKCKWHILFILVVIPFLPIEWEIPDALKQAANKLTGREMFLIERQMKEDTYDIRERIVDRTLDIIADNPFFGAGFGNQEQALKATKTGVTQGESQIIDLLLDGGLTYLIAFAILTLAMVYYSWVRIWHRSALYVDYLVFLQTVSFLIMCGGNEMLSSLGWIYMGTLVYLCEQRSTIILFGKPKRRIALFCDFPLPTDGEFVKVKRNRLYTND